MFGFSNYSANSIYYVSNKLLVGKMKHETDDVAIEEFFLIKAKDVFIFGR